MKKGRTKIEHKSKGCKSGVGICAFISFLFKGNELSPTHAKMTDNEIARRLEVEFPNRKSAFEFRGPNKKRTINEYRHRYNVGLFSGGIIPSVLSFRYNSNGQKVLGRREEKVLTEEEIDNLYKEHHARQNMESIRKRSEQTIRDDT